MIQQRSSRGCTISSRNQSIFICYKVEVLFFSIGPYFDRGKIRRKIGMEAFAGKSAGLPTLLYDMYSALLRKLCGSGHSLRSHYYPSAHDYALPLGACQTQRPGHSRSNPRSRKTGARAFVPGQTGGSGMGYADSVVLSLLLLYGWEDCLCYQRCLDGAAYSCGRLSRPTGSEGLRTSKLKLSI